MNGPEHYREAEALLAHVMESGKSPYTKGAAEVIACAQVHATLALAAATAEQVDTDSLFVDEWAGVLR